MPATTADNPVRGESPAKPAITVTRAGVVIGSAFLPDHDVTVRIARRGEDISDYLNYTTDRNGHLYADLPATALTEHCKSLPPTIGPIRMGRAAGSGATPASSAPVIPKKAGRCGCAVRRGRQAGRCR